MDLVKEKAGALVILVRRGTRGTRHPSGSSALAAVRRHRTLLEAYDALVAEAPDWRERLGASLARRGRWAWLSGIVRERVRPDRLR